MSGKATHTPGPWAWMGNGGHDVYLATTHSGRRYVMGFRRMGLQGAQPVFQINQRMVPAADLLQFEVGDRDVIGIKAAKANDSVYRYDIRSIAAADAHLIAAAPDLLEVSVWALEITDAGMAGGSQGNLAKLARAAIAKASGTAPSAELQELIRYVANEKSGVHNNQESKIPNKGLIARLEVSMSAEGDQRYRYRYIKFIDPPLFAPKSTYKKNALNPALVAMITTAAAIISSGEVVALAQYIEQEL